MKRNNADVVDLEHCRVLVGQKFEAEVYQINRSSELDQVVLESSCPFVASIHGVQGRAVDHHAYKAFVLGTLVEEGPELEVVRYASSKVNILIDRRGMHVRLGDLRAHLVELVGEARSVTGRGQSVPGIDDIFGDPRCETAFEATVTDGIIDRTRGCAGGSR